MRLAILADIHGNYQALEAVLADIASQGVDRIYSLGDNIGYGPQPEEVVGALRDRRVISVMGNHELALISRSYCNRLHATARESLFLSRTLLSDHSLAWLEELPAFHLDDGVRFVHGCPPQSITVYLFAPTATRLRRVFASYPERFCFAGHTHDLGLHRLDGGEITSIEWQVERRELDQQARYLCLPGSVGQPRDTLNWLAKYMLWDRDTSTLEVRAVIYDVRTTIRLLGDRGFPVTNAKRLYW